MAVVTNRYGKILCVSLSFKCFYVDLDAINNYRRAIIKLAADGVILPFKILTNTTLNKRQSIYYLLTYLLHGVESFSRS